MSRPATIHASAVLVGEIGVLVRGPSGSGKSALVLSLLDDGGRPARLVADDRVVIGAANGRLIAAAPPGLAGLIEIRGQGIVSRPHISPVVIRQIVDLAPPHEAPRMPELEEARVVIEGIDLPRLILAAGTGDGGSRLYAALATRWPKHL